MKLEAVVANYVITAKVSITMEFLIKEELHQKLHQKLHLKLHQFMEMQYRK